MKTTRGSRLILLSLCLLVPALAAPLPAAPTQPPATAASPTGATFVALLFAAPGCEECEAVKQWWTREYPLLRLAVVNIERPENFTAFLKLEKPLVPEESARGDFPALLLARPGCIQYGARSVAERRAVVDNALHDVSGDTASAIPPALVALLLANPPPVFNFDFPPTGARASADHPPTVPPPPAAAPERRYLAFFHQPGCRACSRIEQELRHLESAHPEVCVDRFDVTDPRGKSALLRVTDQLRIPETGANPVPLLVWESGYLPRVGRVPADLLAQIPPRTRAPAWRDTDAFSMHQALARVRADLERVTWGVILISGLIDGINPCAFAAVVFLISYLGVLGRNRKEILLLGASYCTGVFVTYFLIGLGLLQTLHWTETHQTLKLAVNLTTAGVAAFFALLHARDALVFWRRGRASEMKGGLSAATVRKIHGHVRRLSAARFLLPAGLLLGAFVASLELACTGQVYFPNLVLINRAGATWHSRLQLLAYNIAFIVPLLGVTAAAAGGVSARGLAGFARQHVVLTKLLLSLLFAGMALLILLLAWSDVAPRA